jgi:SOS-response transcriptional repressor LexA
MTSRASNWPDPVPYSELSERQQEILEFLWNCPSPYSPSFREIGNAVGLTGPSAVRYQIVELERKGWVQRHPGSAATGSPTSARPGTASRAPGRWAPASIISAAASRTCSRRARSAASRPPPSGYLMHPA